jgi:serine/threonine protein kinase
MSAPVSSAEFIERVRKSGLCTDSHLDRYLKKRPAMADTHAEPIAAEMVHSGLLTDFQARQILGGRHPNFFIAGKYRILELLGRGGMGSVFLCEHVRMRRLVAVKVLPQECESDPEMLARFEREAQAVAAFDHPNVVHAHDIDQADGRHFLVMEFVDGVDLQSFVTSDGAMTPERAAWCVAQTARGLHHAWLAGWVHRDIKPGNLLVDRAGCVKILVHFDERPCHLHVQGRLHSGHGRLSVPGASGRRP